MIAAQPLLCVLRSRAEHLQTIESEVSERKLDECLRSAHAQAQDGRRARKCEGNVAWHVPRARASGRGGWWWPPFILTVGPFPSLQKMEACRRRYFLFGKYLRRQASKVLPLLAVGEITSNMKNIFHTHQFVLLDRVEEM